ncbi:MAG: hypothetical protein ACYTEQ_29325 [Planctomycetota bacterium]|jgi:hypothetical protein
MPQEKKPKKKSTAVSDSTTVAAQAGAGAGIADKLTGKIGNDPAAVLSMFQGPLQDKVLGSDAAETAAPTAEEVATIGREGLGMKQPGSTFQGAADDVTDDGPLKQDGKTLELEDFLQAMVGMESRLVSQALASEQGQRAESYDNWSLAANALAGVTGLPGFAMLGSQLGNKANSIRNALIEPIQGGMLRLMDEYNDSRTAAASLQIGRDVEAYGKRIARARADGDIIKEGELISELRTLLETAHGVKGAELESQLAKARSTILTKEEEVTDTEIDVQRSAAESAVRGQITEHRRGAKTPDSHDVMMEYMKSGNLERAMDAYTGSLKGLQGSGYTARRAILDRFALEKPTRMGEIVDIKDDSKYYHRTKATDQVLSKLVGEKITPESAMTPGYVSEAEKDKYFELEGVDTSAPFVALVNQTIMNAIQNGRWTEMSDGWHFFPRTSKSGGFIPLVDKVWKQERQPPMDVLYAELDANGLSENLLEHYGIIIEALR